MLLKANCIEQGKAMMDRGTPIIYAIQTERPNLASPRFLKKDQTMVFRRKPIKETQGKHCTN